MAENLHRSACGQYRLNLSNRQAHWSVGGHRRSNGLDVRLQLLGRFGRLRSRLAAGNKPYMLIVQGLVFAVIYYFVFDFAIRKFNLMTPGREAEEVAAVDEAPAAGEDKYITMAPASTRRWAVLPTSSPSKTARPACAWW